MGFSAYGSVYDYLRKSYSGNPLSIRERARVRVSPNQALLILPHCQSSARVSYGTVYDNGRTGTCQCVIFGKEEHPGESAAR